MKKRILSALAITVALCLWAKPATAQNWDINALQKINSLDGRFARNYSKAFSESTPYIVVGLPSCMAIAALITKDKELMSDAIYIGSSVIEAVAITYAAKEIIGRPRPFEKYPELITPVKKASGHSMPSAHTAAAFSLATSLSIRYPKWYVIAPSAIWAGSVAFSRMNMGVHYPSDVITGALVGSGCAVLNIYVNKWLEKVLFDENRKHKLLKY